METLQLIKNKSFLFNSRTDKWWVEPLLVLLGLGGFIVYSTYAAFQGQYYWWSGGLVEGFGGYLSPFYSPLIYIQETVDGVLVKGAAPIAHALFGPWPEWWPALLPASPAFLILAFPGAFRFTCYYYRGAYYKAFIGTPPACAVSSLPHKPKYSGETFLLIFQNLHRYALYFAIIFLFILSYDAFQAYFQGGKLGIGVGSLVLTLNPIFLGMYTLGCHSFRHLIGGRKDCFSCCGTGSLQNGVYHKVSWLNSHHKLFAWISLFWVGFSDFYVRMVSMGHITDLNTWGI